MTLKPPFAAQVAADEDEADRRLFLGAGGAVDLLHLGADLPPGAHLRHLAAAFGGGLILRGHTVVVSDAPRAAAAEDDPLRPFFDAVGCAAFATSPQRAAYRCP